MLKNTRLDSISICLLVSIVVCVVMSVPEYAIFLSTVASFVVSSRKAILPKEKLLEPRRCPAGGIKKWASK